MLSLTNQIIWGSLGFLCFLSFCVCIYFTWLTISGIRKHGLLSKLYLVSIVSCIAQITYCISMLSWSLYILFFVLNMKSFEQIALGITALVTPFGFHFLSGYFALRLYVTFKNTPYQLSKCTVRCIATVFIGVVLANT